MKKIFGLLMILVVGSITQASDNRSAPNVFSSGSTISSSQMNENFNFLASEIREKDVNCDNGETITDAINEGYNSLTIYGTCDGGVMVYRFDPNVFGVTYSQMSNKPISHLILKGGDSNRASKIINTSGGMNSMVTSKGYLQLYNLTFNDKLSINDGGMISATEINFEVTVPGEDNRIGAYGNSELYIDKSTINAEVDISESSLGIIKETTITAPVNSGGVNISDSSHLELEDTSSVTCNYEYTCINVDSSSAHIDDTNINNTLGSGLGISRNSSVDLSNSTLGCGTSENVWSCINTNWNSHIEISGTTITNSNPQARGLDVQWNSTAFLINAVIDKIELNATSSVQIDGDGNNMNVKCHSNSYLQDHTTSNSPSIDGC